MGTPRFEPDVPLDPYRPPVGWTPLPLPPPPSAWKRWGRPLALFVVTACSVFLTGALVVVELPDHSAVLLLDMRKGAALAVGLLSILLAHEMGHYLACRYHGVDATLPHFLPALWLPLLSWTVWAPLSMVGTFGAFIRIRSRIPNRKALFDIGVAGPLAGFVVCLPVLFLGMHEARLAKVVPQPGDLFFGEGLLFQTAARLVHGNFPESLTLEMGPLGLAAWFGLFLTALNLIPIGQLDGGHLTYAIFRDKAEVISRVGSWVTIALIYFGPTWILWSIVVRILGRGHPPTIHDDEPIGWTRIGVGVLSLAVFVLCFVPNPIIFSWQDTFEALRRYLHR